MTTSKIVTDKQGSQYQLRSLIAGGATAEVWAVDRISSESNVDKLEPAAFVVKLGKPDVDPNLFEDELKVLNELRSPDNTVVWASKGTLSTDLARPALVMEKVNDEWRIFRQQLNEQTMLQVAVGYVKLLDALHTSLRRTANDRKIDDIYWNPQQRRLIVLDWNVTRHHPDDTEQYQREVRIDLRIFAGFWYQMLVRDNPPTHLEIDDTTAATPERWRQLRRGTRRLIVQARSNRPGQRYETAEQFLEEINWFSDLYKRDSNSNLQEAEQYAQQTDITRQNWERISDLLDLVERGGTPSHEQRERVQKLRKDMQPVVRKLADDVQRALHDVKQHLRDGYLKSARKILEETTRLENLSVEQHVQLQRWLALTTALQECERQKITTSDLRPELISIVEKMDAASTFEQRREVWNDINTSVSSSDAPVTSFFRLLQQEINVHQTYQQAVQKHQQAHNIVGTERLTALEEAHGLYNQVQESLNKLEQLEPAYGTALRTMLFDLPEDYHQISEELERVKQQAETRKQIAETTTRITEILQNALKTPPYRWPEELSDLLSTVDPRTQPQFFQLKQIGDYLKQGQYGQALSAAQQLRQQPTPWEPSEHALELVSRIIVEDVRTILQNPPFYRSRIIEAIKLLDRLPKEPSYFKETDENITTLRALNDQQEELYQKIVFCENNAQNSEKSERRDALEQAKQADLEFFTEEEHSVSRLLECIDKAWLKKIHQLFSNVRLDELGQEVSTQWQQWKGVGDQIADLQALQQINTTLQKLQTDVGELKESVKGLVDGRNQMQVSPGQDRHSGSSAQASQSDFAGNNEHVWQEVINRWQPLLHAGQTRIPRPLPDADLLEETTRLMGETPPDTAESRQKLCSIVKQCYDMMIREPKEVFRGDFLRPLIWVGILSCRCILQAQDPHQNGPFEKQIADSIKRVANLIRTHRTNGQGLARLEQYLKPLAAPGIDPNNVIDRVMKELGEDTSKRTTGRMLGRVMIPFLLLSLLGLGMGGLAFAGFLLVTPPITLETTVDTYQLDANSQQPAIITAKLSRRFGRPIPNTPEEVAFFVLPPDAGIITRLEAAENGAVQAEFTPGRQSVEQVSVLVQAGTQLKTILFQISGVPALDATLAIEPGPDRSVVPEQTITAKFSLTNTGTTDLDGTRLILTLPPGLALKATDDSAWQQAGNRIIRPLELLRPNATNSYTLPLAVDPDLPPDEALGDFEYVVETAAGRILVEQTDNPRLQVVAPSADKIDLVVEPKEWLADGTAVITLTATVHDQVGNPAPDGTEVQFHLEPQTHQSVTSGIEDLPSLQNVITDTLPASPTADIRMTEQITATLNLIPSDVITRTTIGGTAVYTTTAGTLPVAIKMIATANNRRVNQIVTQQPCGRVRTVNSSTPIYATPEGNDNLITTLDNDVQLDQVCATDGESFNRTRVILVLPGGTNPHLLVGWVNTETDVEDISSPN